MAASSQLFSLTLRVKTTVGTLLQPQIIEEQIYKMLMSDV